MQILEVLDRCTALERKAGQIYAVLATRFPDDGALRALWRGMAGQEREHARRLARWRGLIAAEPVEHRPTATGFAEAIAEVEATMGDARARAGSCQTPDEAFAIALDLETSELDELYERLLKSSPVIRRGDGPDVRWERNAHHAVLLRLVRERSRDEHNRLRAAILAVSDAETSPQAQE